MVRRVNNINKKDYTQKGKSSYLVIGLASLAIIAVVLYLGLGSTSSALAGPAPSGNNCPENVAYLQTGVDKYIETTGQMPTELSQLIEKVDDQPFVEELPACPSGNVYLIDNGKVIEAAK